MDAYGFDVRMTPAARGMLRPDEALVLVSLYKIVPEHPADL